ncbi:hypothetical protein L9F63_003031, partial [Diploptera punctata]
GPLQSRQKLKITSLIYVSRFSRSGIDIHEIITDSEFQVKKKYTTTISVKIISMSDKGNAQLGNIRSDDRMSTEVFKRYQIETQASQLGKGEHQK